MENMEMVYMIAGWAFMILSELIAASKLKSNSILELLVNILKMVSGK